MVKKLLNIKQIFIENSFKSKKIIAEFGHTLDIAGKPLMNKN
jgi:hypothetical protein